ncbi:aldehyde dehydrogenase [Clostridium sp. KNHs214]|uniref:aldehyde dehydrogenase n=1 Tax=Clostridium sp. KNHs214 TaxID=1540257 RepID=UPI00055721F8|nr:aldehyde dehydrogenase [Clostridium sp. KNHs214]
MDTLSRIIKEQREFFNLGITKNIDFRINALEHLKNSIENNETLILDALKKDLNKNEIESYMTEIGISLAEITYMIKSIRSFSRAKRVRTPLAYVGSRSYIVPEPLGLTLVISPWNYPFQLAINPLIGSIAAGNCCIVKTSSMSPNTSNTIKKIVSEAFEDRHVYVVENSKGMSSRVLEEKFDYIFFTGSPNIGRVVMEAASKNLTPVTLELGGKSPCIIHNDADIKNAAKGICFGKFSNAGQTCVSPDYVLVQEDIKNVLIEEIKNTLVQFYGQDAKSSPNFGRIINDKHFNRLKNLISGQDVVVGGYVDEKERFISPTVLNNVSLDAPVMDEEIFGPILPIIEYETLKDAINIINDKPKPLALYIFSSSKEVQDEIVKSTSSGGVCINDTLIHMTTNYLPFGGVGESGMGSYHGRASFDTFSHNKSVLKSSVSIDTKVYPPYNITLDKIKKLLKFL